MKLFDFVVECVVVMCVVSLVEVMVKCCIGVDEQNFYDVLLDFIVKVSVVGVCWFMIYVCKVWLQGLSFKENCDIFFFDYDLVCQIKVDNFDLYILINGGIDILD